MKDWFLGLTKITETKLVVLLTFVLTLLSFTPIAFWSGYLVYVGIHQLYVPLLLHEIGPTLFARDFSIFFNQSAYTLFDEVVINIGRYFGTSLPVTFFILEYISRFFFLGSIIVLCRRVFASIPYWFFVPLLFTPLVSMHGVFSPETLALGCAMVGCICVYEKKFLIAAFPLGAMLLIHPITALFFLALFYALITYHIFFKKEHSWRLFFSALIPFVFLGIYKVCTEAHIPLLLRVDEAWRAVVLMNSGLFTSFVSALFHPLQSYSYSFFFYAHILVFLLFFRSFVRKCKVDTRIFFYLLLLIPPILGVVQFIGVSVFNLSFVAGLQLFRSFFFWQILLIFVLVSSIADEQKKEHQTIWGSFFRLGLLFSLIVQTTFLYSFVAITFFLTLLVLERVYKREVTSAKAFGVVFILYALFSVLLIAKHHIEILRYLSLLMLLSWSIAYSMGRQFWREVSARKVFLSMIAIGGLFGGIFFHSPAPTLSEEGKALCAYIDKETDHNSLFLTEPFVRLGHDPVQLFCRRSVFVNQVDGDQAILNREYAFLWRERFVGAKEAKVDTTKLPLLVKKYGIDYILSDGPITTSFPLIYQNKAYYLYKTAF